MGSEMCIRDSERAGDQVLRQEFHDGRYFFIELKKKIMKFAKYKKVFFKKNGYHYIIIFFTFFFKNLINFQCTYFEAQ